jgi:hypothetical protein
VTKAELIQYLRSSVNIQSADVTDTYYLSMSDEEIELYLKTVLLRDFPTVPSLDLIPAEDVYPVILLAKKELYYTLATVDAPFVDLTADNNNSIKRSQRFEHYMKLASAAGDEYEKYLEDGGAGHNTLVSSDVLISDRYATRRNYEKGAIPVLTLYVDSVTATTIELSWSVRLSRFKNYKVYVSHNPIWDEYSLSGEVAEDADLVATIIDVHQRKCRIEGLLPDTAYYVMVSATEMSSLTGRAQTVVTTEREGTV